MADVTLKTNEISLEDLAEWEKDFQKEISKEFGNEEDVTNSSGMIWSKKLSRMSSQSF